MINYSNVIISGKSTHGNPIPMPVGGSLLFNGVNTTLTIPGNADWAVGTGDFTIEWFQYQTFSGGAQRPFTVGTYPSASIAVSIESGGFYFWANGGYHGGVSLTGYLNTWVHFACVRIGGTLTVYQNGVVLFTDSMPEDITDNTTPLALGAEYPVAGITYFNGNITNFRWVKGSGIYNAPFVVPTAPLSNAFNTRLLLRSTSAGTYLNDSGVYTYTVTNQGGNVIWDSLTPFYA